MAKLNINGTLRDVPVDVAHTYGSNVEIRSGISEGDIVAVITSPSVASVAVAGATANKP